MIESTFIQIEIPGEPVAKARARTVRQKGKVRSYTPVKSKNWAEGASLLAKAAMRGKQRLSGAVSVHIRAVMPIPVSWPLWKRNAAIEGVIAHTVKPDMDNIEKNVCDALNGIIWIDDSYIVTGRTEKEYGIEPKVTVFVYHDGRLPAQIAKKSDFEWM